MTILFPTHRTAQAKTASPATQLQKPATIALTTRPAMDRDGLSLAKNSRASKLQLEAALETAAKKQFELPELKADDAAEAFAVYEARQDAEALWAGDAGTQEFKDGVAHEVLENADDVTDDSGANKAARQVEENQALVDDYLKAHPELAEVYGDVQKLLENDPHGQLAMQLLLLEGTLTAEPLSKDGQNLAQTLAGLAEQPLAEGLDRAQLVGDLVREIAQPSAINQKNNPTCAATTPQILMAQDAPAEYARILAGLASVDGTVELANGDTIAREEGSIAGIKDDGSTDSRAITGRLWQPAMMEYANGDDLGYSYGDSRHSDDAPGEPSGLTSTEFDRLYDGLLGEDTTRFDAGGATSKGEVMDQIEQAVASGQSVPVGIVWNTGGHKVLVTDIRDGYVYFTNPHGTEERMTVEDFEARLRNAHVRSAELDFAA